MDAFEYGRQGMLAQQAGVPDQAAILFTHGIQLTPPGRPNYASKLLRHRADCYWDLQRKEEACMDMKRALELFPGIKVHVMGLTLAVGHAPTVLVGRSYLLKGAMSQCFFFLISLKLKETSK